MLLNPVCLVNSVLQWCSQPIVYWLYQGWACIGWSDLTELQEREHTVQQTDRKTINNVQLKGVSLVGNCRGMFMNLFILTGNCMLQEGR